jgi:hypothetical protein
VILVVPRIDQVDQQAIGGVGELSGLARRIREAREIAIGVHPQASALAERSCNSQRVGDRIALDSGNVPITILDLNKEPGIVIMELVPNCPSKGVQGAKVLTSWIENVQLAAIFGRN